MEKEYNSINFMEDVANIYAKFPMAILSEQANQMAGEWQSLSMKYVYKMGDKIDKLQEENNNYKLKELKIKKAIEVCDNYIFSDETHFSDNYKRGYLRLQKTINEVLGGEI